MQGRKYAMDPPLYVIPASDFMVMVYKKEQAVGFQFQAPNDGSNVFVAIPGQFIRLLIDDLKKLIDVMPEIEEWELPSPSYAKKAH